MRNILQQRSLFFVFVLFYIYIFSSISANFKTTISSDGEGYYSYLPALYLLKDKTFEKNNDAKFKHVGKKNDYVLKTEDGRFVNKYFGGVSLVATPAFLVITGIVHLMGDAPDGYNLAYFVGMFAFSILLFVFGYLLYRHITICEYGLTRKQQLIFIPILLTAPWFFSSIYAVMYANNYLFCILVVAYYLMLKIRKDPSKKIPINIFFFLIGLVAVIRPTSLIFLVILPYFFDNWSAFWNFFKKNILVLRVLLVGFIWMILPIIYQFGVWKWQTGSFFLWSYGGEGFNWTRPQLWEQFFSYRTGILFHSPILLIALIYSIVQLRSNRFKSVVYLLFFFLVCYVSSSWWCYDFETKYGLRNFNEFYVFLFLPLFDLVKNIKAIKWTRYLLVLCSVLSLIRFNQFVFEYNQNQRYDASSYWKSLAFWKKENKQRWIYYRSLPPYGKLTSSEVLIEETECAIAKDGEFYLTKRLPMHLRPGERAYLKIQTKRSFRGKNNDHVPLLVIDYTSSSAGEEARSYTATSLHGDKLAEEEDVIITRYLFDNKGNRDSVAIYIWNQGFVEGTFRNFKVELERYDAH